ncbi:hypothetical protein ACWDRX_35110, partial [Streptomyces nigra]
LPAVTADAQGRAHVFVRNTAGGVSLRAQKQTEKSSRWPSGRTCWISLVICSYLALVDTANGIAVLRPPTEWMFPNVDLTVHLHRQPRGGWTGLDTTVSFGPSGQGLTSTVLHDVDGPVGTAQQILTVRPR